MARKFRRETELGPPVIAWLEEHGWDPYQEVKCGGATADVVATHGPLTAVVEMKLSLSLDVIAQAKHWARVANVTFVAVPVERHWSDGRRLGLDLCASLGVGVMVIRSRHCNASGPCAHVERAPALRRRVDSRLRDSLRPEHKTHAKAGSQGGKRWTEFQETSAEILKAVAAKPGITLHELLNRKKGGVKHHYSNDASARACVLRWVEARVIKGVRAVKDGKDIRMFPTAVLAAETQPFLL